MSCRRRNAAGDVLVWTSKITSGDRFAPSRSTVFSERFYEFLTLETHDEAPPR
jgi:hypothetical protein